MKEDKTLDKLDQYYQTAEQWVLSYYEKRTEYYEESKYIRDASYNFGIGRAAESAICWKDFHTVQFAELECMEKWLLAVELMWSTLPPKKKIFVEQRRRAAKKNQYLRSQKKKRINWVTFVQEHYARAMAKEYGREAEAYWISDRTIKKWWDSIIQLTRLIAMEKGCTF